MHLSFQASERSCLRSKLAAIRDEDGPPHRGAPSGDPRSRPREDHANTRPLHQRQRDQEPPKGLPAKSESHVIGSAALGCHVPAGSLLPFPQATDVPLVAPHHHPANTGAGAGRGTHRSDPWVPPVSEGLSATSWSSLPANAPLGLPARASHLTPTPWGAHCLLRSSFAGLFSPLLMFEGLTVSFCFHIY